MTRGSVAAPAAPTPQAVPDAGLVRAVRGTDPESLEWVIDLRSEGEPRHRAIARLHGLLLRAAGFELARRRARPPHLDAEESGEIALQAAADALVGVLIRLDDYRGESRFTTWASKFALLEAAVAVRARAWQERGPSAGEDPALGALLDAVRRAMRIVLSDHQRDVFTALALDGVPIDVLAERLGTTRGALYASLREARRELRAELGRHGVAFSAVGVQPEGGDRR